MKRSADAEKSRLKLVMAKRLTLARWSSMADLSRNSSTGSLNRPAICKLTNCIALIAIGLTSLLLVGCSERNLGPELEYSEAQVDLIKREIDAIEW